MTTLEITGTADWMAELSGYGECECCELMDSLEYDPHGDWLVCMECEAGLCDIIEDHGSEVDYA